ncbi:pentapeptide repeat-containing protein [Pseudomonas sp. L13]|uniref:pentapeptide repeat-containing protein n=1 Tax=Pseudomonas sp. L13 TaxID=343985 RepID=UPI00137A30F2|nr:pentapeptide repeat-containing protein [Pseudomonas sp. L13]NCE91525.1 hypothetical protein [Pseudomonas sp. L13]
MTDQKSPADAVVVPLEQPARDDSPVIPVPAEGYHEALKKGNRSVITDYYVHEDVSSERTEFAFKVYVRLNAKKIKFTNVSFQHSVFDGCYFNNCSFDSCDFTGCRFIGCNLHQSSFAGCKFDYAVFERCQIDDDILEREAPREENLQMRFARSLRMNFQQIGDAKAVNRAISLELEATSSYLRKSWSSSESYYRTKYKGWKKVPQFFKWLEFKILDVIWGNGENTLKLLRAIIAVHVGIAAYDTIAFGSPWDIRDYVASFIASPGVFFGIVSPHAYPVWFSSGVAATRLLGFAFLTAILVKRFGRR